MSLVRRRGHGHSGGRFWTALPSTKRVSKPDNLPEGHDDIGGGKRSDVWGMEMT